MAQTKTKKPGKEKILKTDEKDLLDEIINLSLSSEEYTKASMLRKYARLNAIFGPIVVGQENLPDQPFLMVGNHSVLAQDVQVIQSVMLHDCDRYVRGMADKLIFKNEKFRRTAIREGGAVMGHPYVCSQLMTEGVDLMVFPGGAHEVNKPASQMYELKWKQRLGFVRLAAEQGYTILPFACVGPEEFYGRYMESQDLAESWLGKMLDKSGIINLKERPDMLPPIPRGLFGTFLPKPQRVYMSLGKPVDLSRYKGSVPPENEQKKIRDQIARSIERQIRDLLLLRVRGRGDESWWRKLLT